MGVRAPGELTAMDLREPFATGGKGKEQGRRQAKGRDMKAGLKKGAGWEWEG